MPVWPTLQIGAQRHSLLHLEPFAFLVEKTTVLVEFSCHCFTRKPLSDDPPSSRLSSMFEGRVFDPLRYGLSTNLPNLIRTLPQQHISSTREEHLVYVQLADGFFYHLFFKLERIRAGRVKMLVRSAYPATQKRHQKGRMRFTRAIDLIVKGKALKFP